ncbi:MAG: chromate transporter [Lachnospiraceae bacterium]|nr:chromate transporter [Lachnospiraceae bacterium]
MKKLWELFITFAKIGGFTFGGGYAMLPMLKKEVVEHHHWATEEEILDYFAIGQCTPGIIAVNTATFIGYNEAGVPGGIFATLGVIAPSIVIISVIAACVAGFADYAIVQNAFAGIRACVVVLILSTVYDMIKKTLKGALTICMFAAVLLAALFTPLSTYVFILAAFVVGIIYHAVNAMKKEDRSC